MNFSFALDLMKKLQFPPEACAFFADLAKRLEKDFSTEISELFPTLQAVNFALKEREEQVKAFADRIGVPPESIALLFLMQAAESTVEEFSRRGVPEPVVWDTLTDFRYKLLECRTCRGVWGTNVSSWFSKMLSGSIVKLGRLQFESRSYPFEKPFCFGPFSLCENGSVITRCLHIPSAPEPFTAEARLESYRMAFDFFGCTEENPLICTCRSWLLFPEYRALFVPGSNLDSFVREFQLVETRRQEWMKDAWRIFGAEAGLPPAEWPEDTSLRRAVKRHVLRGGAVGSADGILIFDGREILTRK